MALEGGRGGATLLLIGGAAAVAVADWIAVAAGRRRAEAFLKPLVPLLLAVAAAGHWWFAAALLLCLAGDVLLLPQVDRFVPGLVAFLAGHLAFAGGLVSLGLHWGLPALAVLLPAGYGAALAPPLLRGAPARLRRPITAYMVVILAMGALAALTLRPAAIAGAALFVASDSLLAWNRFRGPLPTGRVGVMVTYHLALGLLTIASWT